MAVAVVLTFCASGAHANASFSDVTSQAGLSGYVQHLANPPASCILGPFQCAERMTGGAAVADYDGDGDPDLFVTILDGPDKLFENQGDGSFVDVASAAGLAAYSTHSNGAAFADLDNDGDPDLYVTVMGIAGDATNNRNYLFVNQGDGSFSEEALARGAALASSLTRIGFSVAVGDYDRDGWLDLFVAEWRSDALAPGGLSHARLLRNRGASQPAHFDDVTAAAGIDLASLPVQPPGVYAFAPAFSDLDQDGWPDLVIASDFGTSRIFWNRGDGSFSDGTAVAGVGGDENGMGSTFGDLDGDGLLDWFVTSIRDPAETCETESCNWGYTGNRLYVNRGTRTFVDRTDHYGVRDGAWGWGASFFDWDNDADLDLVMTNGVDFPGTPDDPFLNDAMRLWRNEGTGAMTERAALEGVTDTGSGKGLLVFDYDGDGDLDLFVVNNAAAPVLYENTVGAANTWLRVELTGVDVNRDALGARVSVTPVLGGPVQVREVGVGSHFLGTGEPIAHFGLGPESWPLYEVRVRWPNSRISVLNLVARNQTLQLGEPTTPVCSDGFDNDGDGLVDSGDDPGCDGGPLDALEQSLALPCDDGLDNDADGAVDFPADPGCTDPWDASERAPGLPCDDGLDNDADTATDYPADPACATREFGSEWAACQDGIDNDGALGVDFDGGASHNGGVPFALPDPECGGRAWDTTEACGLGGELALLVAALALWRSRSAPRRRTSRRLQV